MKKETISIDGGYESEATTKSVAVIVDLGKFDWVANAERYPQLNQPEPAYHGVVYTEVLGSVAESVVRAQRFCAILARHYHHHP